MYYGTSRVSLFERLKLKCQLLFLTRYFYVLNILYVSIPGIRLYLREKIPDVFTQRYYEHCKVKTRDRMKKHTLGSYVVRTYRYNLKRKKSWSELDNED